MKIPFGIDPFGKKKAAKTSKIGRSIFAEGRLSGRPGLHRNLHVNFIYERCIECGGRS